MEDLDATVRLPKPVASSSGSPASPADDPAFELKYGHLQEMFAAAKSGDTSSSYGWQPPTVEDLQKALPQYEITQFLARGGMGAVYKGTQKTLRRAVAIKVLPPEIEVGDMQFAERFKREAQSMAQLAHPNIVAVHDAGETAQGLLYFVMEFIEGTDLQHLIAREGRLDSQRALSIITSVCDALAFAHEEGIVHRDIKPSNIMLDKKGRVKVADFGLAKTVNLDSTMLTGTNLAMGTPDFIAPEALIAGIAIDGRADLYAVGVMFYQMLTGKIPRGRFQLPSGIIPQTDPRFDAIIDKAMQTDREHRYSSAIEMRADLDRLSTQPIPVAQPSMAVVKPNRGKSRMLIAAAGVSVLLMGGGSLYIAANKSETISPSPSLRDSQASTDASYPQPPEWTDVTAGFRNQYLASGALEADGDWVKATAKKGFNLRPGLESRNPIVRVVFSSQVEIWLRRPPVSAQDIFYGGSISRKGYGINLTGKSPVHLAGKFATYDLAGEHEAVFAAQGDTLTLWLDGKVVDIAHDRTLTVGGIGLMMTKGDPSGDCRIKKVEYGELPDGSS